MNAAAFIILSLAMPGAVYQGAYDWASRVHKRRRFDPLRVVTTWLPLSFLLTTVTGLVCETLFGMQVWLSFRAILGDDEARELVAAPVLTLVELTFATMWLGVLTGWWAAKFHTWNFNPLQDGGGYDRFYRGIVPPVTRVTVRCKPTDEGTLYYRGILIGLRFSPEGELENIVLLQPIEKEICANGSAARPFQNGGPLLKGPDALVVSPDEIASLGLETFPATGQMGRLDYVALTLVNSWRAFLDSWIRPGAPGQRRRPPVTVPGYLASILRSAARIVSRPALRRNPPEGRRPA